MTVSLDWENLGFSYMKLPYRYLAHYRNGAWEKGELTEDATWHDIGFIKLLKEQGRSWIWSITRSCHTKWLVIVNP